MTDKPKATLSEWIAALEGPYADRKGKGELRDCDGNMCCLGVLVDLNDAWDQPNDGFGSRGSYSEEPVVVSVGSLASDIGIPRITQGRLAELNDKSSTFAPVIAALKSIQAEQSA